MKKPREFFIKDAPFKDWETDKPILFAARTYFNKNSGYTLHVREVLIPDPMDEKINRLQNDLYKTEERSAHRHEAALSYANALGECRSDLEASLKAEFEARKLFGETQVKIVSMTALIEKMKKTLEMFQFSGSNLNLQDIHNLRDVQRSITELFRSGK